MFEEISAHMYKMFKMAQRWPGETAHILVYPTISILSLGLLAFFVISQGAPWEAMNFVFVGVLIWNVYDMSQRTMAYGITEDIWSGTLKHTFAGMAHIRHFIIGTMIYGAVGALIGFIILGVAGLFAFNFNIFTGGIYLILNVVFVFIFASGVGMMLNSILVTRGSKYMAIIWILPGLIMVFSGVYYPPELLPGALYQFSQILPSTHSLISLRSALAGMESLAFTELWIGAALSGVFFAAGALMFKLGVKRGKVSGVITKY